MNYTQTQTQIYGTIYPTEQYAKADSSSLVDRNRAFKQRATEYWLYMLTYIHGMRLLEAGWSWLQ